MTKTIVHILGCHLQAKRLNGDGWEKIMWADGTLAGRLMQGLVTAYTAAIREEMDVFLSFGTGASMKDGVVESRFTLNFAKENFYGDSDDTRIYWNPTVHKLLENALVDDETQNTSEEVRHIFAKAALKRVDEVVFVTSAFHASRAIIEIVKAHRDMFPEGGKLRAPCFAVVASLDSPGDTIVIEEPHRGDLDQVNFGPMLRRLFKFLGKPELSRQLFRNIEAIINSFEKGLK